MTKKKEEVINPKLDAEPKIDVEKLTAAMMNTPLEFVKEPVTGKLEAIKQAVAQVDELDGNGNVNMEAQAFRKIKQILSK
jgi:hypothetical protein